MHITWKSLLYLSLWSTAYILLFVFFKVTLIFMEMTNVINVLPLADVMLAVSSSDWWLNQTSSSSGAGSSAWWASTWTCLASGIGWGTTSWRRPQWVQGSPFPRGTNWIMTLEEVQFRGMLLFFRFFLCFRSVNCCHCQSRFPLCISARSHTLAASAAFMDISNVHTMLKG